MSEIYIDMAFCLPIRSADKIVILAIATLADDEGRAIIEFDELLRMSGMTDKKLHKCLINLQRHSLLEIDVQDGKGALCIIKDLGFEKAYLRPREKAFLQPSSTVH